jgi:hypothetical protein
LFDPVLPSFFLAWAKRTDLSIPAELIAVVESRGVVIADWRTRYEEMRASHEELTALVEKIGNDWRELYDQQRRDLGKAVSD